MRTFALRLLVIAALLCVVTAAFAGGTTLRAVRHNRDVNVSDRESLAAKLVALLESCSVNSTVYAVSGDTWAQILASNSFIHVVFSEPQRARPKSDGDRTQEQQTIREILLPLPDDKWPEHIFVKSGGDTLSFTKYDPLVLREIVLARELQLRTVQSYEFLLRLPSKQ